MSPQKILVIDHDEISHFIIGRYIKKLLKINRRIVYLTSPQQINYELDDFTLIITDIWFPHYDVFSFISKTKSKYPKIKIIVLTASYTNAVIQQAKEAGADEVLAKPIPLEKLRDTLAQLRLEYYSDSDLD